jgi:hypothetical protein
MRCAHVSGDTACQAHEQCCIRVVKYCAVPAAIIQLLCFGSLLAHAAGTLRSALRNVRSKSTLPSWLAYI